MTTRTWIRRLFAREPRTIRKDRVPFRPHLERLEDRLAPTVNILNNFSGLQTTSAPDTCGAAGPDTYVETVNHSVAIYDKGTGNNIVSASMITFFQNLGFSGTLIFSDSLSSYDQPIGRFTVADVAVSQDSSGQNTAPSSIYLAVSTSSNPRTLTAFDWGLYQITTSEGDLWSDYPGNIGYNQDALVFTFNMATSAGGVAHTQVVALKQTDLASTGTVNMVSPTGKRYDLDGQFYRPVTMHDSAAGGPMWLATLGGGSNSINLVRIDNVLNPTFPLPTFNIAVDNWGSPNNPKNPKNPDSSTITSLVVPGILNAAEANNTIVACQNVGVGSNEDDARWYEFNVSNINNPTLVDQGNVGFGPKTYTLFPGIDINSAGAIGMSVIRSGDDSLPDYMSVYVTGRTAADASRLMDTPVLAKAGDSNNTQTREGDFSGINVESDGTFWTSNEFTTGGADGSQITHFRITDTGQASVDSNGVLQVVGSNTNDNIVLRPYSMTPTQTEVVNNGTALGHFANFSSINVVEGGGTNTLTLTDTGGSSGLQFFPVPVTYTGGGGSNSLVLDDSTGTNSYVYTVTSTVTNNVTSDTVSRNGFGGITYTNVSQVALYDGSFQNTVQVMSTSAALDIRTDSQKDSVYVGSNGSALGGTLLGIQGGVNVHGLGAARLVVDDSGDTNGTSATLSDFGTFGLLFGLAP
jgi:hypothetical protein